MLAAGLLAWPAPVSTGARAYDPLAVPDQRKIDTLDLIVHDPARRRDIPIRVHLNAALSTPAPLVIFSHGLGGSREGYAYLGEHWAARGYAAVFLQHPGSDTSVWAGKPTAERMRALEEAANLANFLLRVKDVPVVLDQLAGWNASKGQVLSGRLDLSHVGMSGHSFGAVTTQAVSGQRTEAGTAPFTDPRILAAIALSPSSPARGTPAQAFGDVRIPWLLMTGTKDFGLVGGGDPASRMAVFPALRPGNKYEVVLDRAEHSAFSDRPLPGDSEPRNPNHHRAILAVSTAFWDAFLRDDVEAKVWLNGDGPRSVLEKHDRWQKK